MIVSAVSPHLFNLEAAVSYLDADTNTTQVLKPLDVKTKAYNVEVLSPRFWAPP